jgi:hypothetical protein
LISLEVHERFNTRVTDAAALTVEIQQQGYRGSHQTVRRYLQPFRSTLVAPPPIPVPPTIRTVTGWPTRRPDDLDEQDTAKLTEIIDRSPALQQIYEHVREFAKILVHRQGRYLLPWSTLGAVPEMLQTAYGAMTVGLDIQKDSPFRSGVARRRSAWPRPCSPSSAT